MATLKKRRSNWYARVLWYENAKKKEKQVPLRTDSKVVARERLSMVNKVELDIKSGMNFTFPWLSNGNQTKLKRFTLLDATNLWMLKRQKYRNSTLNINKQSIRYIIDFLGNSFPLESITNAHIESFIEYMESKGLKDTSINIHLRSISTLLRYWLKMDKIVKVPIIKQIPIRKVDPIYITDDEFRKIIAIDWLEPFYKRVFLFHRDTGLRLREPNLSVLDGAWIDIPNESKGGVSRNIELDKTLKQIFIEYKDWLDNGYGSCLKDVGDHLSKKFKKALIDIGSDDSKHFHSLRHTFAVRRLLQGTSIYELKLMMGHSSVTTTEVYSRMNLKRVGQDFPTLLKNSQNSDKIGKVDTVLVDTAYIESKYIA